MNAKNKHRDATSTITTRKDEKDGFTRTAIVLPKNTGQGSLDLVTEKGTRLAQVNIFYTGDCLMIDVIDVDGNFKEHRALGFEKGERHSVNTDALVGAHFEGPKK